MGEGGEKGRNFRQSEQHKQKQNEGTWFILRTGNCYDCGRECEGEDE